MLYEPAGSDDAIQDTRPKIKIERSTYFNDHLRVTGYAFAPDNPAVAVGLILGDGRTFAIDRIDVPGPDLTRMFGHQAAACRFDAQLAVGPNIVSVLSGTLGVTFADGTTATEPLGQSDPTDVMSGLIARFQTLIGGRPEPGHMLEIGSRERTGANYRGMLPKGWDYTGFDILDGPNVDIVGDAHRAGSFLPHDHFDAAMSYAVFEHLLMPWKAIVELNKVMKVGGIALIIAPQTWPLHEEPADYFRFSGHAWKGLLNTATGFEIIEASHGGRAFIVPHVQTAGTAFGEWHTGALMSGVLFRKTGDSAVDWPVLLDDVSGDVYPA